MADADGSQLIVIGASAGGIEALSVLVGTLPKELAAPVVVAQHVDPGRESHLREILARRSALPIVTVEGTSPLENGTIYVVPANRHVAVTDHEVAITDVPPRTLPSPSVDTLLSTAADSFGERLVAVILTGSGSDGAAGARDVKASGGTVVIQDPDSARLPGMPGALAPSNVDISTSIEAMGPLLQELVTAPLRPTQPDDEPLLATFLEQLRETTGIDFSAYKLPTILRRLQRRMAATKQDDLRAYVRYASAHPDEYQRLVSTFLIKVTGFFRDEDLFDHLRDVVIPQLIDENRDRRELRIWSAGCATGEEAYSIAILVAEALQGEIESWNVRIFGTDLDADALAYARRAVYPAASLGNVPAGILARHFEPGDGDYEIRKHIRLLTVFGQHDLALRAPFPRIDLALCRNVLIYFTPELRRRALQLFAFSLREGGWLALGKAESTSPLGDQFVLDQPRIRLFRRRGQSSMMPPVGRRTPGAPDVPGMAREARSPAARSLPADGLLAANVDVRSANADLLMANEEVSAATEEVQTLNVELQATNEELVTLNEELQATVEELNTTNDDMQARAADLQEATVNLEDQRRAAEHDRARLSTLIESLRDAVLVVDGDGKTVLGNAAFTALEELAGRLARKEPGLDLEDLRARVARGEEFDIPMSISLEGRRRWYEAYGRPAPSEMDIGGGGILVVHDTTELSLRRLQEDFVAMVAHELRTPLTALRGYLELLARAEDRGTESVLPLAISQADRLHRMIDELIDATRAERGRMAIHPEPVDLVPLIADTIAIAQRLSDTHELVFKPDVESAQVVADKGRIQQVLLNLLMNAIVHAPSSPSVQVRIRRRRRRVEIEVEDRGPGIPAEAMETLFSRFHAGRQGGPGLGLGLYIAREIVHAHGGTIDVDTEPGEGSTFVVRMPLDVRPAKELDLDLPYSAVAVPQRAAVEVEDDRATAGIPRSAKSGRRRGRPGG